MPWEPCVVGSIPTQATSTPDSSVVEQRECLVNLVITFLTWDECLAGLHHSRLLSLACLVVPFIGYVVNAVETTCHLSSGSRVRLPLKQ